MTVKGSRHRLGSKKKYDEGHDNINWKSKPTGGYIFTCRNDYDKFMEDFDKGIQKQYGTPNNKIIRFKPNERAER